MTPEYRSMPVQRTAHYQVTGPESSTAVTTTLACHGYGQLATYLTGKFRDLSAVGHRLVSAEGLNKFYWEGTSGQPVATWMTSHHRQSEITDYSRYLSDLYDTECRDSTRKVLLGFSQGGTTLWRWILHEQPDFDVFINWAGWIPEDEDYMPAMEYLAGKRLIHLYSETDIYLTSKRKEEILERAKKNNLAIEFITYDGGHRVVREVLDRLYADLA